jgi:hypothetical protein
MGQITLWRKRVSLPSLPRRGAFLRTVRIVLGSVVILQALTAAVLLVVAKLRRQREYEHSFPHMELAEVQVGDNRLQLY